MTTCSNNVPLGKYLISPLIRMAEDGGYAASVSIRSGRGSGTHDRILRLIGKFSSPENARRHALAEGFDFVRSRLGAATAVPPLSLGAA